MHKKDLGTWGEMFVVSALLENNINVYTSVGDNTKADIVAEDSAGNLYKIQVKTKTREKNSPGTNILYFYKTGPNYQFKYTEEQVDWFALVDTETKKIAWIPSIYLQKYDRAIALRHDKPKNNQTSRVSMFDDFTEIPFK